MLQGAVRRLFRVDNSIEFAVLGLNAPAHVSFHIFNRINCDFCLIGLRFTFPFISP